MHIENTVNCYMKKAHKTKDLKDILVSCGTPKIAVKSSEAARETQKMFLIYCLTAKTSLL